MRFYIFIFIVTFLQKCRAMHGKNLNFRAFRVIFAGHSHLLSGVPLTYNTTLLNKISVIAVIE